MCGFAGFIDSERRVPGADYLPLVARMADTMRARGPDDGHAWADPQAGIALGFRRLAIVDLTAAGRQPMVSADGRLVIVYNGEVYNAPDLRPELEALGVRFRGHSDTEVILEACAAWGAEATVPRLIGMFAFALWDRGERRLTLVRDRLGIKPLYWGRVGGTLLFGSEPKSFTVHPAWHPTLDAGALAAYLRFGYVPAPRSIYQGIRKLRPGYLVAIDAGGTARETCYWDACALAEAGLGRRLDGGEDEARDALEALLRDAVRRRMLADVPVGAFLSGGVDSSAVVALMQAESARPVKTFSIGFREQGYDEAPFARAVAAHLGTDHHELYVEPGQALEAIPRLPEVYDEPFSDSSQIPTLLISELTRQQVTVALSGDGGDELFAGYGRYAYARRLSRVVDRLPWPAGALVGAGVRLLPGSVWDRIGRLLPRRVRPSSLGYRLQRLADLLDEGGCDRLYRDLVSQWHDPGVLVPGVREPVEPPWTGTLARTVPDFTERMQLTDLVTYLPDDILTKVDRASMAVSLEARVPLLDHRVVELSWRLPPGLKVRGSTTKWLLRQVLYRHVPRELIERPKMGFGVPIDAWLRGPLRDWAEDLLAERRLREEGLFAPDLIRRRWADHLEGRADWHYPLWVVLTFQAWRRRWLDPH